MQHYDKFRQDIQKNKTVKYTICTTYNLWLDQHPLQKPITIFDVPRFTYTKIRNLHQFQEILMNVLHLNWNLPVCRESYAILQLYFFSFQTIRVVSFSTSMFLFARFLVSIHQQLPWLWLWPHMGGLQRSPLHHGWPLSLACLVREVGSRCLWLLRIIWSVLMHELGRAPIVKFLTTAFLLAITTAKQVSDSDVLSVNMQCCVPALWHRPMATYIYISCGHIHIHFP